MPPIWIVSYFTYDRGIVVHGFYSQSEAQKCYLYYKERHPCIELHEMPIYSTFENNEAEKGIQ